MYRIGALAGAVFGVLGSVFVAMSSAEAAEPPANLRVISTTSFTVKLAWDPVATATGYTVSYSKESDFDPELGQKNTNEPSFTLTGLTRQTAYFVRVRSTSVVTDSDWSPRIRATTGPIVMRVGSFNIKQPDEDTAMCGSFSARARDIVASKVDVLGIQEAYQGSDRVHLMEAIADAGGDDYKYTLGEGAHGWENGWDNRIVYNSARVDLINSAHVPFKTQDGSGLPREFVWGTFELKTNRHRFLVYSTHLEPGGSASLKKAQWDQIRANALRNQLVDGKTLPVFIVGDFNTSKFREPADVMLPKMKGSGFGDVLGQTYKSYKVSGQRVKSTAYVFFNSFNDCKLRPSRVDAGRVGNNIDWIFATNSLQIPEWRTWVRWSGSGLQTPIASDHFLVTIKALLP
jgi:endonuclease/exonuclease/phosphatase family metal-dependent hydrolase